MVAVQSLFAAVLALLPAAQATQTFYNSGQLNGWDGKSLENKGTISEVTNVVYKGTTAIKVTQTFTPGYTGRYHSEVVHNRGYTRGDSLFYGFMFRLSDTWDFEGSQLYNLAQFIADRPGAGCDDDDWMPSTMVWIQGNQLYSRYVNGHYRQPNCGRSIITRPNLATVSPGVWHKVILQIDWESDGTGYFKIWFDGTKVHEEYNISTTIDDDSVFQFHVGLYANSWHDQGNTLVGDGFRQVWYDEVAIGTTFADVDPDQYE